MITNDKIIEIFCATDEFSKKYEEEMENMPLLSSESKVRRRRAASMFDSEIMTIIIMFHFGTFDKFKHYYLHFIKHHLKSGFPDAVSYNLGEKLKDKRDFFSKIDLIALVTAVRYKSNFFYYLLIVSLANHTLIRALGLVFS